MQARVYHRALNLEYAIADLARSKRIHMDGSSGSFAVRLRIFDVAREVF